jgi:RNA polymerase sigma-70 factor, ECF subfamily
VTPDDEALLSRARANDTQALAELYDAYAERIYGYLYRRVGSAQIAEDLTGDVFVKVLEALGSGRPWHTSFGAWLYRIAHNVVVDWYRSQGTVERTSLDEWETEVRAAAPNAPDVWAHRELRQALMALTEQQQQVLILRFGEGLKVREIAEIMGKSVGAIEGLQHRALAALREQLEG